MSRYDAVLVLGGGVRTGGALPSWVIRRLERAMERRGDGYIIALSAGTPHRPPPVDSRGFPIFESVAEARFLIQAGVPGHKILQETGSYDTVGNAYFARVIHTDPAGLLNILVITSDVHLERARAIFEWVFALTPVRIPYALEFEAVSDPSLDAAQLAKRAAKEASSFDQTKMRMETIRTLAGLHAWLFTEHGAYKAGGEVFGSTQLNDTLLDMY